MPLRHSIATLVALALLATFGTGNASAATPGEVTTYPVKPCSNLLAAPEGILVGRCAEAGVAAEPAVVNVLPGGGMTSHAVPAEPSSLIAIGPSGELWLGLGHSYGYGPEAQAVDRVAADSTVRTFLIGGAPRDEAAYFHGIAVDGEGTCWAAIGLEENDGFMPGTTVGGKLLRLFPDGQMKSFRLPHHLDPQGLVLGPAGSVWFTAVTGRQVAEHLYDPGVGFIGRLDSAGKLALFRIPGRGGGPDAIAIGPEGTIWFSESDTGAIRTIAPDGTFGRRYPLREWRPQGGLAFGREGDLWTGMGGGGIARITPWGQQTLFPGESRGVITGRDGDIWSRGSESIERLVPGAPGIEVRRTIGHLSSGSIGVLLACGGSASACEGTLDVELKTPPTYRRLHRGEPGARSYRLAEVPYSVPAESQAPLRIPVSARALSLISLFRHYEIREGVPIEARATVAGGPPLEQTVRAPLGTRPRPGRRDP